MKFRVVNSSDVPVAVTNVKLTFGKGKPQEAKEKEEQPMNVKIAVMGKGKYIGFCVLKVLGVKDEDLQPLVNDILQSTSSGSETAEDFAGDIIAYTRSLGWCVTPSYENKLCGDEDYVYRVLVLHDPRKRIASAIGIRVKLCKTNDQYRFTADQSNLHSFSTDEVFFEDVPVPVAPVKAKNQVLDDMIGKTLAEVKNTLDNISKLLELMQKLDALNSF